MTTTPPEASDDGLAPDERALVATITETREQLAAWGRRSTTGVDPMAGSALAADDQLGFPIHPSRIALGGLAAAWDHLNAIRALIEARQLGVSVELTILRTALLGAAEAAWLLHPADFLTRRKRALRLTVKELRMHRMHLTESPEGDVTDAQGALAVLTARDATTTRLQVSVGLSGTSNISDTGILTEVGPEVFPTNQRDQSRVLSIWRQSSAAAHALGWSMAHRRTTVPETPDHITGPFRLYRTTADPAEIDWSVPAFVDSRLCRKLV